MSETVASSPGGFVAADSVSEYVRTVTEKGGPRDRSWFHRLVTKYLHYHYRGGRPKIVLDGETERARAEEIIRRTCIKSALAGAGAGAVTTGATIITAETSLAGAAVALPVAAAAIGGEMLYRSLLHIEMTCDIADVFGVRFNPDDPTDLWRLLGLAFRTSEHEGLEDPGKELVTKVAEQEEKEIGEEIGHELMGESVLRNVVPFLGVAISTVQNWRVTRRIGDTVRRYVRYQRALGDALQRNKVVCHDHLEILIEGLWYIFTADGQLSPEETAILAEFLDDVDPPQRAAVKLRFELDDQAWIERLSNVPEPTRDDFLHTLEVAAAVDKKISLPEQKILRRAAHALGRPFDMTRIEGLMRQFEDRGVLETKSRHKAK